MLKSSGTATTPVIIQCPSSSTNGGLLQDDKRNTNNNSQKRGTCGEVIFDSQLLQNQQKVPNRFIWSQGRAHHQQHLTPSHKEQQHEQQKQQEQQKQNQQPQQTHGHEPSSGELNEPLVNLEGFFRGDEEAIARCAAEIREACLTHGTFQVINHGVDTNLIQAVFDQMDDFFGLPVDEKLRLQKKPGEMSGYSGAHGHRFSTKLPWKEMFSFEYEFGTCSAEQSSSSSTDILAEYFSKSLSGNNSENARRMHLMYCQAMKNLSLAIFELLAIGLGVDRNHYREFYEDGGSLVRCNYYPTCKEPGLTFGTGPHHDPNSLTLLHQDQVGGLEVFFEGKWLTVKPRPDAIVVGIGDTFTAMSNGRYKSCLHRAVVNKEQERKSVVFFVSPREDKVIKPPDEIVEEDGGRREFPDFKWADMLVFTQRHYRADVSTLQSFFEWLPSSSSSNQNPAS